MGPPSSSGFYVSRAVALLLAGLVAALLLALAVLAALYGHCERVPPSELPGLRDLEAESSPPLRQKPTPTPKPSSARELAVTTTPSNWRPPGPWDQLRLPPWLVPLHYDLELWPQLRPDELPAGSLPFTGRVNITVRCTVATSRLLLHSLFQDCERAEVRGPLSPGTGNATVGRVPVDDVWFALDTEYMVLELSEPLKPGSSYELQLSFSGLVKEDLREGLFLNVYTDQGERRALLASQLEPTFARYVFPCFDEPALKATFNITMIHHPSYVALSNMPKLGQSEKEDVNGSKWTVTTFSTTPHMPTYLVAFVICDYDHVNRTERGKEIRIWARKDAIANGSADFALNITGPIFSFLEDLFNISYSLPKTDIIALPSFDNHAMENWGLMIFDESGLLLEPKDQLTEKKTLISYVVSHEIGHQWFGNLVTMNWWNNIWLNEGFASYFEFEVINYFNPKLPRNEIFFSNILHNILREDHALVTRAVAMKVENFKTSEIQELFDIFTYSKGASMARMLSCFLNEHLFVSALKSYLKTFSYSNAEQDDLWRHFQMAIDDQSTVILPATIKNIMDSWTHQSGFPVITLNVSTGVMKQEPFYLENIKNRTLLTSNDTWIVPILWIKNGTTQPLVWLDQSSKVFPEMQVSDSDHDWVILNLNMTGYYRVNYDKLGWKKLNQQLEKDPKAIPVIHRLQLIDDAFSLSKNNYIEIETALELTKYLAEEDEIIVWHTVLVNLVTRDLVSEVNIYDIYSLLKRYLLKRLNLIWNIYSTIIRENVLALQDDYLALISLEKLFVTACWLGLEDCLQLSKELFAKWVDHPENEIPYPIKDVVLCYGIALGSDKEWDILLNTYTNTTNKEEKIQLAYAMSCSKDPWILNRYMEYAISTSPFTSNETNIIEVVASSEVGRYVAKDFLVNNWQAVSKRYGTQSLINLIYTIGRTVTTDLQIVELQQFFSNMLEEHQRIRVHANLQTIKNENLKNKKLSARIAAWLRRNT
ncbi:laeverin [Homo sapiens]|uniref:Aminopeptidase Q n=3 Tax=Homo sapiens TaxID=9606 RepID=AMPQ_HUMAN|nr:aminopeptidase Q [Homo sapiens]Q6Q4G3.4 RecName: Full=Aminopeptidase Q; Short=AP-Q; Short=APQ; AltName: Full=CHL2 antigen; AltName: Full=Laeverin [Homo sapiens]KAI4022280.1 laeverin [Homo sapiens]KAI4022281.1 laeverin [Homo sapiens]|eukprot:NP_776161.3 aminopeptidase Q [Homo sapiens]